MTQLTHILPPTPPSTEMGGPPTLPPPTNPTGPVLTPPSTVPATGDITLATPSSLITSHVKLPKLSIKKFNGDLTKWVTFWDSFDSSIHSNLSLSNADKFNYLNSFLESTAAELIAGLTFTSANYEKAVTTLKRRFGNTQLIVNKHMDTLLNLPAVNSRHDLRGLWQLYDTAEAHMRGLRALGVTADSYGGLLTSILMSKLPLEIRLIISRELTEDKWDVGKLMKIIDREVDARERSATSRSPNPGSLPKKPLPRGPPTAAALSWQVTLDPSTVLSVSRVTPQARVLIPMQGRKHYVNLEGCLRKGHVSRDC